MYVYIHISDLLLNCKKYKNKRERERIYSLINPDVDTIFLTPSPGFFLLYL